jgi:hypothetical protein
VIDPTSACVVLLDAGRVDFVIVLGRWAVQTPHLDASPFSHFEAQEAAPVNSQASRLPSRSLGVIQ